jgi:hypothetical protein
VRRVRALSTAVAMSSLALCGLGASPARASSDLPAAVVVIDDLPADGAVEAAKEQVPGQWRIEQLKPEAPPPRAPQPEIEDLSRAYTNADFLRCLTELQRGALDLDRLLERGRRTEAAQVGTIAAACAMGAGDEARARELVRRLLIRELDYPDALRKTTPQFQRVAEEERQNAQRWGRVAVDLHTDPEGASVQVDGIMRCRASPCRVHVLRGEHVVVAEKMGRRPRAITALLDEEQTLTISLDQASADEAWHELSVGLGSGIDPSGADVARTASAALGAGLIVLVWPHGGQVHANVYQRGGTLTHVAMDATGPAPAARAVRAALREWQSDASPRSMLRQPLFWTTALGVAVASATAVFFIFRPPEVSRDIVFK